MLVAQGAVSSSQQAPLPQQQPMAFSQQLAYGYAPQHNQPQQAQQDSFQQQPSDAPQQQQLIEYAQPSYLHPPYGPSQGVFSDHQLSCQEVIQQVMKDMKFGETLGAVLSRPNL
jgi:hypothetical protein